tara:strand:- start:169 stop:567 length:399 start_codon:yes stop_codon:yes gene_type:complete
MISPDAFTLYAELIDRGGNVSKRDLELYCRVNKLGNFDDILDELNKAKLIIALYSYIVAKNSYLIENKKKENKAITNNSLQLIKAAAKMANVNYRAVVNNTSKRPNPRQKVTQNLSRLDVATYWMEMMKKDV